MMEEEKNNVENSAEPICDQAADLQSSGDQAADAQSSAVAVSYTHLTLPTT